MDGLLKLPPLGNTSDVRKLRQTYDEVEAHVRGLQALEVPTESYGSFLVPVLMTKIPEDIRLLVGREMKDGEWNLTQILQLLRSEVENRESVEECKPLSEKGIYTVQKIEDRDRRDRDQYARQHCFPETSLQIQHIAHFASNHTQQQVATW